MKSRTVCGGVLAVLARLYFIFSIFAARTSGAGEAFAAHEQLDGLILCLDGFVL
jgi:hypothetical protein